MMVVIPTSKFTPCKRVGCYLTVGVTLVVRIRGVLGLCNGLCSGCVMDEHITQTIHSTPPRKLHTITQPLHTTIIQT